MLKNDLWLRKRNGSWELKYPIYERIDHLSNLQRKQALSEPLNKSTTESKTESTTKSKTDMYHETSDMIDIVSRLKTIPNEHTVEKCNVDSNFNLDQWVSSGILWAFAEINTSRKEYQLSAALRGDGANFQNHCANYPINIVVDVTDWGYTNGEIEILLETPEEVDIAVSEIEQIASDLNLTLAEKGGKLIDYLKKYRPYAYNAYVETYMSKCAPA